MIPLVPIFPTGGVSFFVTLFFPRLILLIIIIIVIIIIIIIVVIINFISRMLRHSASLIGETGEKT